MKLKLFLFISFITICIGCKEDIEGPKLPYLNARVLNPKNDIKKSENLYEEERDSIILLEDLDGKVYEKDLQVIFDKKEGDTDYAIKINGKEQSSGYILRQGDYKIKLIAKKNGIKRVKEIKIIIKYQ